MYKCEECGKQSEDIKNVGPWDRVGNNITNPITLKKLEQSTELYSILCNDCAKEIHCITLNLDKPSNDLLNDLSNNQVKLIVLLSNGVDVGKAELKREKALLEIRWVEIFEQSRNKGLFRKFINHLKQTDLVIFGEIFIEEDEIDIEIKAEMWRKLGATITKDYNFVFEGL